MVFRISLLLTQCHGYIETLSLFEPNQECVTLSMFEKKIRSRKLAFCPTRWVEVNLTNNMRALAVVVKFQIIRTFLLFHNFPQLHQSKLSAFFFVPGFMFKDLRYCLIVLSQFYVNRLCFRANEIAFSNTFMVMEGKNSV